MLKLINVLFLITVILAGCTNKSSNNSSPSEEELKNQGQQTQVEILEKNSSPAEEGSKNQGQQTQVKILEKNSSPAEEGSKNQGQQTQVEILEKNSSLAEEGSKNQGQQTQVEILEKNSSPAEEGSKNQGQQTQVEILEKNSSPAEEELKNQGQQTQVEILEKIGVPANDSFENANQDPFNKSFNSEADQQSIEDYLLKVIIHDLDPLKITTFGSLHYRKGLQLDPSEVLNDIKYVLFSLKKNRNCFESSFYFDSTFKLGSLMFTEVKDGSGKRKVFLYFNKYINYTNNIGFSSVNSLKPILGIGGYKEVYPAIEMVIDAHGFIEEIKNHRVILFSNYVRNKYDFDRFLNRIQSVEGLFSTQEQKIIGFETIEFAGEIFINPSDRFQKLAIFKSASRGSKDLKTFLSEETLDENKLKAIFNFKQLINQIALLHKKEVVHFDISPGNIIVEQALNRISLRMIDFDGAFKIKDLGSAQIYFKPSYLSPLVCKSMKWGQFCNLTPSIVYGTDLWALGKILMEMIIEPKTGNENKMEEIVSKNISQKNVIKATFGVDCDEVLRNKVLENLFKATACVLLDPDEYLNNFEHWADPSQELHRMFSQTINHETAERIVKAYDAILKQVSKKGIDQSYQRFYPKAS